MIFPPGSLLLTGIVACSVVAATRDDSARLRGVGPEFAKFYESTTGFTCISHPAIEIPLSAVNDDYCDCPDGSDEPGTSACAHLSSLSPRIVSNQQGHSETESTSVLPGFYCKNKGHRPSYVPFQRVNDGVCDYELCCDGSDEWAKVGSTTCEDRCKEIGKEWRKRDEKREKSMVAALQRKKALLVDTGRMQKESEDHVLRLSTELKGKELIVQNLKRELENVQKQEETKSVRSRGKGKVHGLAELAKARVEELRNILIQVRSERDQARIQLAELEDLLTKFKAEYNPNFNDEGVKRAVRGWEEYAARDKGQRANAARDRDLDTISKADSEASGIDWSHWENEDDTCESSAYALAAFLPSPLISFFENKIPAIKSFLELYNVVPRSNGPSSFESAAVKEARDALREAERTRDDIQKLINDHKSDLETDYGKASIFRALKGVCVSKDAGEYTYEHCFLDQTKQIPKKGGSSVQMGRFTRIGTVDVDKFNEAGKIITVQKMSLEYANGQSCWNGPARSTTVILECGEENEILKVSEDEKCVYSMIVNSPAACPGGEEENDVAPRRKDEL